MGKRSDFERIGKDFYRTIDQRAELNLLPHLKYGTKFAEVCAGDGIFTDRLVATGFLKCVAEFDPYPMNNRIVEKSALDLTKADLNGADTIITNPPWSRSKESGYLLHKLIMHCKDLAPTWFLFDADWPYTLQSVHPINIMSYCTDIIPVGRLIWIEGTTTTGKDNCAWYRFDSNPVGFTKFHSKTILNDKSSRSR